MMLRSVVAPEIQCYQVIARSVRLLSQPGPGPGTKKNEKHYICHRATVCYLIDSFNICVGFVNNLAVLMTNFVIFYNLQVVDK